MRITGPAALFAALCLWASLCAAGPSTESFILVANPQLRHPLYGRTVLVVKSFGADQHFGFIVNRPGPFTLRRLFPGHRPSQKVVDPVFIGGPVDARMLFALVARAERPGRGCVELAPGLFAVLDGRTVNRVIEANPDDARFLTGLVVWRPGELRRELALGAWYVLDANASIAVRDPRGLWEELVARSRRGRGLGVTRAATAPGR